MSNGPPKLPPIPPRVPKRGKRIISNPAALADAIAQVIDSELEACDAYPYTAQDKVDARRLYRFQIIWELLNEHTAGRQEPE